MAHVFPLRQRTVKPTEHDAITHELNNVLTAIAGYAQLILAEGGAPESVLSDVGEISEAAKRAVELSRKLQSGDR